MKTRKFISIIILTLTLFTNMSSAQIPTVPNGYYIEPYAAGFKNVNAIAFSPGGEFGYEEQLFVGDSRPDPGTIYRVPQKNEIIYFTNSEDDTPRSFAFAPTNSTYQQGLYVSQAYEIRKYNSDGTSIKFASINAFGWDIEFNDSAGFGNYLYHADGWEPASDGEAIRKWFPDGSQIPLITDLPEETSGLAFSPSDDFGDYLYVAFSSMRGSTPAIRKIQPDGSISDFVVSPLFKQTNQLAFDTTGYFNSNLFVSDWENNVIFEIDPNGDVSTFATGFSFSDTPYHINDGGDILFGTDGAMYIADGGAGTVWRIAQMPDNLNYIEIIGPSDIFENSQACYKVVAHFNNSIEIEVTNHATLSLNDSSLGAINIEGCLDTNDIEKETTCIIKAEYEFNNQIFYAEKNIIIYVICPYGYALSFDGTDDLVRVPRSTSLEPGELTIELWAKLDGLQTRNTRMVRKAGHFGNGYLFAADASGDKRIQIRVEDQGLAYAEDTVNNDYYSGQWHHFAGVYSQSDISLYIDGLEISTANHTLGPAIYDMADLFIGSGRPSPDDSEFFRGLIDELRIWDYPRTQEQIQSTMHTRLAGTEAGLVGYWDFDEGDGQTVYDLSGNGNNGFLGDDPNNPDSADPMWVESDAPVGICSSHLIAKNLIEKAIKSKKAMLTELQKQIENENTAIDALNEMLDNKEFDIVNRRDIIHAKNDIHTAIQSEKLCGLQLNKSIKRLIESLLNLASDYEITTTDNVSSVPVEPDADINDDGKVDSEDLAILCNQWLSGATD